MRELQKGAAEAADCPGTQTPRTLPQTRGCACPGRTRVRAREGWGEARLCREQAHRRLFSPSARAGVPAESTERQGVPSPPRSAFSPPLFTCCLVAKSCLNSVTPWTVACQAPVFGISQTRIPNELTFPSSGDLPIPGIESTSPALAGRFFTTKPPGKSHIYLCKYPKGSLTKQSPQSSLFPLCCQCLPTGNHQAEFCLFLPFSECHIT